MPRSDSKADRPLQLKSSSKPPFPFPIFQIYGYSKYQMLQKCPKSKNQKYFLVFFPSVYKGTVDIVT